MRCRGSMLSRRTTLAMLGTVWAAGPAWAGTCIFSKVETALGAFTFELFPDRAPITVRNYLAYVDGGFLTGASVYRVLGPPNQRTNPVPISVAQWGRHDPPGQRPPLPPIAHEPTSVTGLHHLDGTVSMARLAPGTASSEMFVCIGDQPELDEGGHRNSDGLGFAAFGRLTAGHETIRRLSALATADEFLDRPVPITQVTSHGTSK